MNLLRDLTNFPDSLRHGAVAIGNFDGVHLGHKQIVQRAHRQSAPTAAAPPSSSRSIRIPSACSVPIKLRRPSPGPIAKPNYWPRSVSIPPSPTKPTKPCCNSRRTDFFQRIVHDTLQARAMVEGTNFYFGHHRAGNIDVLQKLCATAGIPLEIVEPVMFDGETPFPVRASAASSPPAKFNRPIKC